MSGTGLSGGPTAGSVVHVMSWRVVSRNNDASAAVSASAGSRVSTPAGAATCSVPPSPPRDGEAVGDVDGDGPGDGPDDEHADRAIKPSNTAARVGVPTRTSARALTS